METTTPCARCGAALHQTTQGVWTTRTNLSGRCCGRSALAHCVEQWIADATPAIFDALVLS